MRCNAIITAVTLAISSIQVMAQEHKTRRITIENSTPNFSVVPTIEIFGKPPETFLGITEGKFEKNFTVAESDWYIPAKIKLAWKRVGTNDDGTMSDFDQRIELRIRKSFPDEYYFKVFYSNDRSQREMRRLENKKDIEDQFEVFFRGIQIARYYRDSLGPKHPLTRRAAKIAFDAAVMLAEYPRYYVVMSDEAESMAANAHEGEEKEWFKRRAEEARSVYWFDLLNVDEYLKNGKCNHAQSMILTLKSKRDLEPKLYKRRFDANPDYLDNKAMSVQSKCGS